MSSESWPGHPGHDELVTELRQLREKGLFRLRGLELPALTRAAGLTGFEATPTGVETLLREAVAALGDEETGRAAAYLFGLVQGTIGRSPTDLRERAAREYRNLTPETFRKGPERELIIRIADEILRLQPFTPRPTRDHLELLAQARAQVEALPAQADTYHSEAYGPFVLPMAKGEARVSVDLGAVENLRDVAIIVSSENTYLLPARTFDGSLSAHLRLAASTRDQGGRIIRDVVGDELRDWVERLGRPGNPVEPGTVATTSPGRLERNGVRRLYHAAVVVPRRGQPGYDVPSNGVQLAVQECFALARVDRESDPAIDSISFPLFGAGEGGLTAAASFFQLWPAIQSELAIDPAWHVHLTTWTIVETLLVLDEIIRTS